LWKNCTPDFEYFSMFIYVYQVQSFMVTPSITHNIIVTCHFSWGCSMLLTAIFHGVSPKEMTNEHTLERKCWQKQHIPGHLRHKFSIAVNQVNVWFSSFLFSPISMKSCFETQYVEYYTSTERYIHIQVLLECYYI